MLKEGCHYVGVNSGSLKLYLDLYIFAHIDKEIQWPWLFITATHLVNGRKREEVSVGVLFNCFTTGERLWHCKYFRLHKGLKTTADLLFDKQAWNDCGGLL